MTECLVAVLLLQLASEIIQDIMSDAHERLELVTKCQATFRLPSMAVLMGQEKVHSLDFELMKTVASIYRLCKQDEHRMMTPAGSGLVQGVCTCGLNCRRPNRGSTLTRYLFESNLKWCG